MSDKTLKYFDSTALIIEYGKWICMSIMLFSSSHIYMFVIEFAILLNKYNLN